MTLKPTNSIVQTQYRRIQNFQVKEGVRQGDAISATLINLALYNVLRDIRTRRHQIVAYADDPVIFTKQKT